MLAQGFAHRTVDDATAASAESLCQRHAPRHPRAQSEPLNEDDRLSPAEVLAFFQKRNPDMMALPEGLMENEDNDKDGFISWDEFSGPKGKTPPKKDEL